MSFIWLLSATTLCLFAAIIALIMGDLTLQQVTVTTPLLAAQVVLAILLARRTIRHSEPMFASRALHRDVGWLRLACALVALTVTLTALHLAWAPPEQPPARLLLRATLQWVIPAAIWICACGYRLDAAGTHEISLPQTHSQARS